MTKNVLKFFYITFFSGLAFLVPVFVSAYYSNVTYRSTVLGTAVEQFSDDYNRIVNEKNTFNSGEQVYALTRVFNITNINNFQIKHQLFRDGSFVNDFYSSAYSPNNRWWAETYAWSNLGSLTSGAYNLKIYIKINNEPYQFHRDVAFRVDDYVYNQDTTPTNYSPYALYPSYDSRYVQSQPDYNFNFVWTHTGSGVRDMGIYVYEVVDQKNTFHENEQVFVLGKLVDIRGIDRFKMKYDLYLNNTFYKTLYSWEQKPEGSEWAYNYTWVNFEKLPAGQYQLNTSISINGGSYTGLDVKTLSVYRFYDNFYGGDYRVGDNRSYNYDYNYNNNYFPNLNNDSYHNYYYDNRDPRNRGSNYDYIKMTTGVGATRYTTNICGNNYRIQSSKNVFRINENVYVVTEVELDNARRVEVRHDLHLNNSSNVSKSLTATVNCNTDHRQVKTGLHSNFGRITGGNHKIKSYIRLDNGTWRYLDFRDIKVSASAGSYKYSWTRTGTGNTSNGWYSSAPQLSQKSSFFARERLSVLTKFDNLGDLDNYRVKYEVLRDSRIERTVESQRMYNNNYNYNRDKEYLWTSFGYLQEGTYRLRVYISVNNGSYRQIDTKNLNILHRNYYNNYNDNYNYSY